MRTNRVVDLSALKIIGYRMGILRSDIKLMFGALVGVVCGNFAIFSSPLYVGGLIDGFGFDESQAGLIGTMEIGAVAASCLLLSRSLGHLSLRILTLIGLATLVATNVITLALDTYILLLVTRVGSGIGAGICLAAAGALLSRMIDPDRMVGMALAMTTLIMVVMLTLMGYAMEQWMFNGFVGLFTLLALLLFPLLVLLPNEPFERTRRLSSASNAATNYFTLGVLGLSLFFLFCVMEGGVWSFSERRGVGLGLDSGAIGLLLGMSQLAGLSGAILAAIFGGRLRRIYPIGIGISLMGGASLLIYQAESQIIYALCLGVFGFAFMFAFPYLLGAFAKLDGNGRWAARANGVNLLGGASGPFIAGTVVSFSDFQTLGLFCLGLSLMCLTLATLFNSKFSSLDVEPQQGGTSLA